MTDIKDCTDCGGKAYITNSDYIHIGCDRCDDQIEIQHSSYEAAYFYWNMVQTQKVKNEN